MVESYRNEVGTVPSAGCLLLASELLAWEERRKSRRKNNQVKAFEESQNQVFFRRITTKERWRKCERKIYRFLASTHSQVT